MADDFPTEYDAVVLGTGMTECIIAAAMSRIGMKVLHLDRNDYYSSDWAVFNFKGFQEWIKANTEGLVDQKKVVVKEDLNVESMLLEGEHAVSMLLESESISNVQEYCYIKREPDPEPEAKEPPPPSDEHKKATCDGEAGAAATSDHAPTTAENNANTCDKETGGASEMLENKVTDSPSESNIDKLVTNMEQAGLVEETDDSSTNVVVNSAPSSAENNSLMCSETEIVPDSKAAEKQKEWTLSEMLNKWRYFNLDLSPKVLFSRGSLVELLITSDIAKYCDFKLVSRVLTHYKGNLKPVPCSRADVFSSKDVSIIEKRMMMKLLTFCMEYDKHPEEYSAFENKPFIDFLKSKKLTENILHYVLNSIAMATETTPTLEGLKKTQRFLQSLGRYGNTPFLWPLYGSGEIPQCFCRMCAVFGGIYCLRRTAHSLIVNQDNACTGIICNEGVRIKCKWVVMESSFAPPELLPENLNIKRVSRAILITNQSLLPAEQEQITLLSLPPGDGQQHPITVFELPPNSAACPKGLYVVHMTCPMSVNAQEDLTSAISCLFNMTENSEPTAASCDSKPKVLWSVFFNMADTTSLDLNSRTPSNVFIASGPGSSFHYEHSATQAKEIFDKICPGEEFCPRAPNPEDIIFDGVQNEPVDPGFQNGSDDEESGADSSPQGGDEQDSGVEGNPQDREW